MAENSTKDRAFFLSIRAFFAEQLFFFSPLLVLRCDLVRA